MSLRHRAPAAAGSLLLAATATLASTVLAGPAEAARVTAGGVRCTIVGTPGADHLTGTDRRDVICGRGGNDVIRGGGGADLLHGGPGDDTVWGGTDDDSVHGDTGSDSLHGDGGKDDVSGGSGADDADGGSGNDVVDGGPGADRLHGAKGADVVAGGSGDDLVDGGDGGDRLLGGPDPDQLLGGGGDDDLDGGTAKDRLDGGSGTNWCVPDFDARDGLVGCVLDQVAPSVGTLTVSTHAVDVTSAARLVTLTLTAADDTGLGTVRVAASDAGSGRILAEVRASLTSGDVRAGTWTARVTVPRWTEPGRFTFTAALRDRYGRQTGYRFADQTLTVADSTPDVTPPAVSLSSPAAGASYDVRSTSRRVSVRAGLTDARAGVSFAEMCLYRPGDTTSFELQRCEPAALVRGTRQDGVWEATVAIPAGSRGGTWDVSVRTADRARLGAGEVEWAGPGLYDAWTNRGRTVSPNVRALPHGQGAFEVVGH